MLLIPFKFILAGSTFVLFGNIFILQTIESKKEPRPGLQCEIYLQAPSIQYFLDSHLWLFLTFRNFSIMSVHSSPG